MRRTTFLTALTSLPIVSALAPAAPATAAEDRHRIVLDGVRGPVIRPGDEGFAAEVAGFNLAVTPTPRLVVGATTSHDVAAAVRYARLTGARVRAQATGHGLRDALDDTVLITTRRLTGLRIDPRARTATIGAGVTWRTVIDRAAEHGLAPLCGSSSDVGAVGYSLGGGVGSLARQFGFSADRVRSFDVVTADGHRRCVDVWHHPDLFWALRGARDGLAVVTSMTVDLVPVDRLHGGGIFFPGSAAHDVLHAWRTWAPTLPTHVSTSIAFLRLPPDPTLPPPLRGQFVVHVRFSSTGSATEADTLLKPVRAAAPAIIDTIAEMPFTAVDSIHSDPTDRMPFAESGTGLRELDGATADAILEHVDADSGSALAMVELRLLGGAMARAARVPNSATGRDAAFSLMALGVPVGPDAARVRQQLAGVRDAVQPWAVAGPLNLSGGDVDLWSAQDAARLDRIRRRHDPRGIL